MESYVALLRAVNVGGTGKLPMRNLKSMCEELGLFDVRTYIASGNVVFKSKLSATKVQSLLEKRLEHYSGKPVGVHVRSATELQAVLTANPFPEAAGNRNLVIFLEEAPPGDAAQNATGIADEKIALGTREIYVHYGEGMGQSRLKIPAAKLGTARNMNTVAKLVEMLS